MKKINKKQIVVGIFAILALVVISCLAIGSKNDKENESVVEVANEEFAQDVAETITENLENPSVDWQNGEFEFLSGGYDNREDVNGRQEDRILVYLAWDSSDPVYYTHDWQLDSYDVSSNKEVVVYSTFHTQAGVYRVYRYDVLSGISTILKEFDISESELFTTDHIHLPLSTLELAPDAEHYYLETNRSSSHLAGLGLIQDNFVQSINGGDIVDLDIPEDIYQQYWFSNSEVAFSGADFGGSGYDGDYVQIYSIETGLVSSTLIPVRGAMSGLSPKVSPESTAYAYYDITENHGYACGGRIMDLIVLSYPGGEELLRLEDLHELEYRWLVDNSLEIIFTRIPEVDGEYTPRSQTDEEIFDAIECEEQEIMYFDVM